MTNVYKYPSLTNHYRADDIVDKFGTQEYYATEKIDGSNIGIVATMEDGEQVNYFQSRNRVLDFTEDKSENAAFSMLPDLAPEDVIARLNVLFRYVKDIEKVADDKPKVEAIVLYGELFGGKIQANKGTNKLESQQIRFFDLILYYENGKRIKASFDKLAEIAGEYNTPMEDKGTLIELLKKGEPKKDNPIMGGVLEGFVYKPIMGEEVDAAQTYPVIKYKTDLYTESSGHSAKKAVIVDQELLDAVKAYINENRFNNVISHGDYALERKNIGPLIATLIQDAKDEFIKDNPAVDPDAVNKLQKSLTRVASRIVVPKCQ